MYTRIKDTHLLLILSIFLLVGLIGLSTSFHKTFQELSFYNLLLNFILLIISIKKDLNRFGKLLLILFSIGFISEIIGVQTGFLFGNYKYVSNLGPKFFDVPFMIGFNWAILSIGAWEIVAKFSKNKYFKIILASLIMVLFDFIMEPVAIKLNFWKWENDIIPIYNFISWFMISAVQMILISFIKIENSGIVKWIFILQLLFFSWLNIWYNLI